VTDQERATAFIVPYLGFDPMESTGDIETLTAEFETVRAEERRAIVAWLKKFARQTHRHPAIERSATIRSIARTVDAAADDIERGDHEARS